MSSHDIYMKRAFELAQLGKGNVSPNPLVGCVIIKDDKIIGEGYHQQYGGPHAEVNAVNSVKDKSLLEGSKVVVSLEPCRHHGKTPPCADMLIKHKVGEVIISNIDPNPLVNGKGVEKLEESGIKVTTAVLSEEGKWLNRRFFTLITRKRPYIILKWAQTSDGFLAREDYSSKWISDAYSRKLVHQWRNEEDAILVGTNTARVDNPTLNVRDWEAKAIKQPVRVVIDRRLTLEQGLNLFKGDQPTICFNTLRDEEQGNLRLIKVEDSDHFLEHLLHHLGSLKIQSLIVEGGAHTLNSFIKHDLWDEARIFTNPTTFQKGIKAPEIKGKKLSDNQISQDSLTILKNG